jgi:hypothetical protein
MEVPEFFPVSAATFCLKKYFPKCGSEWVSEEWHGKYINNISRAQPVYMLQQTSAVCFGFSHKPSPGYLVI